MSVPPPERPCSSELDAARQPSQTLPGGHGHLYWGRLELGVNQPTLQMVWDFFLIFVLIF